MLSFLPSFVLKQFVWILVLLLALCGFFGTKSFGIQSATSSKSTQILAESAQQTPALHSTKTLQYLERLQRISKIAISAVDEKSNIIEFPSMGRKVGETGFVWHIYDENYASIIATATIIEVDSVLADTMQTKDKNNANNAGKAKAQISFVNVLPQKYLPTPTNKPAIGDEVHFGTFNSTAFIIAPTLETYDSIRNTYTSMQFLNSDLVVGYLFDRSKFDPKPKVLSNACRIYSVGLLFLVTQGKLSVLDCESLVALDSVEFDTSAVTQSIAPFFSRVQYAASGSLDSSLKRKQSRQYFEYYEGLLKEGKNFK